MEQVDYNLLFRWFVGLSIDDPVWHSTTFTHNRERLMEGDVARQFLAALVTLPEVKALMSAEHFSLDGTLIEARASTKSFCQEGRRRRLHRWQRRWRWRPKPVELLQQGALQRDPRLHH